MTGYLILEDGLAFEGVWHKSESSGVVAPTVGEVVFNTSHSGYEEIATDPSYFSQIVVMTAPQQGNYAVDRSHWESRQYWIRGFVAIQLQDSARDHAWVQRLSEFGIPALSEVDTRTLVIRLRSAGTPWGALLQANSRSEAIQQGLALIKEKRIVETDWVYLTSRKETQFRSGQNPTGPIVAVLDFGSKENILRELEARSKELHIFNSRATVEQISAVRPDMIMLTNGPGDPAAVEVATDTVRSFLGKVPIFGICMGHQILCLALGAKTYKLKFGHRGSNHPIQDQVLKRIYMTSQNHGYAVIAETLPKNVQVTHVNLNDNTVAGIQSLEMKCLGIQYHPENCPGPHESVQLFDYFIQQFVR